MLTPYVPSYAYVAVAVPLFVVLVLLAAIVFVDLRAVNVTRRVVRSVWCPLRDQRLMVELEEELCGGKRLDVLQCAAFNPPAGIRCQKACLRLTRRFRRGGRVSGVGAACRDIRPTDLDRAGGWVKTCDQRAGRSGPPVHLGDLASDRSWPGNGHLAREARADGGRSGSWNTGSVGVTSPTAARWAPELNGVKGEKR